MKLADKDHPFYRPLWRRIAIVAVVTAWLAFELFVGKNTMWIMIAGAFLAYAVWVFLLNWPSDRNEAS